MHLTSLQKLFMKVSTDFIVVRSQKLIRNFNYNLKTMMFKLFDTMENVHMQIQKKRRKNNPNGQQQDNNYYGNKGNNGWNQGNNGWNQNQGNNGWGQ